jgi:hypothetical protein
MAQIVRRDEITRLHLLIGSCDRNALKWAIECGELLLDQRAECRGNWITWLKENTMISQPTASRYMTLANYSRANNGEVPGGSIREALKAIKAKDKPEAEPWSMNAEMTRVEKAIDKALANWPKEHLRTLAGLLRNVANHIECDADAPSLDLSDVTTEMEHAA